MRRTRGTSTSSRTRRRTALVAAGLLAALAAGAAAAPAFAAPASASPAPASARATSGPDTKALSAALAGLPDHDISAALVRVGGDGSWRGTAGVRDVRTGRRPWRTRGSGPDR